MLSFSSIWPIVVVSSKISVFNSKDFLCFLKYCTFSLTVFLLFCSSYCLSPLFAGGLSQQFVFLSCCWILRHAVIFSIYSLSSVGSPSVAVDPLYHNSCVAGVDSKLADGSLLTKKQRSLYARVRRTKLANSAPFWFPRGQADVNISLGQKDSGRMPSISESVSYSLS